MLYSVIVKPSAEKEIKRIPAPQQRRIREAILALRQDPFRGKKLEGEYKDYYSLRIWPYRVIYTIYKQELVIIVVRIGHRQGVY